jgi:hypothetical protein
MFQIMVFVAMAVGAYLALSAVLRMYDVEAADLSKGIGKVTAVVFKNLQQKAASLKNKVSNLRSLSTPQGLAQTANLTPANIRAQA